MRLFFLPGAAGAAGFWKPLGDLLPADWEKTYFSWPGFGDEPHDSSVRSIDDLVDLVARRLGDEPVALLAQSMG